MQSRSGQSSSYRDRTQEFLTVAEKLKKSIPSNLLASSAGGGGSSDNAISSAPKSSSAVSVHSEFNKRASTIGLTIHQTSQMLAKLANSNAHFTFYAEAKRTSVFDDPTVEIQELTSVIMQDITALNSTVVDLQLLCNSQKESEYKSSDTTSHSTTVVDNLKNRLMTATKEFKEVLTMRTENMKVHENRRQLFSASASRDATNPFIRQRPLAARVSSDSTVPPAPWANDLLSSSQLFPPRKKSNGDPSSSPQPLLQQQKQQQMVPVQDSYMQSRAEALQNVEFTIHELSNIFTQLATVVPSKARWPSGCVLLSYIKARSYSKEFSRNVVLPR